MITITKLSHERSFWPCDDEQREQADYRMEFNTDPLDGNAHGGFGLISIPKEVFEAFSVGDRATITITREVA